jgi:hypothetical protein
MSDDLIETSFADLDDYYPGSKRKRKAPVQKDPEVKLDKGWDARPYKKTLPNGTDIEMFTIGALASAVGRPVITIRTWIKEGYIPASPYRLSDTVDKYGAKRPGRRMWSRAMIETFVGLLDKAGLLYASRIEWSEHRQLSKEIAEAWSEIRANETTKKE